MSDEEDTFPNVALAARGRVVDAAFKQTLGG
jgi:hypothetical protein